MLRLRAVRHADAAAQLSAKVSVNFLFAREHHHLDSQLLLEQEHCLFPVWTGRNTVDDPPPE